MRRKRNCTSISTTRTTRTAPLSRPWPHAVVLWASVPHGTAIARMAASLLTFHRDNVIQDTSYGLVTSWEALMEEAAAGD